MVNKYCFVLVGTLLMISSFSYAGSFSNDIKKEINASLLRSKIILTFLGAVSATCLTILPANGVIMFLDEMKTNKQNLLIDSIGTVGLSAVTVSAVALDIALWKKWAQLIKKRMELKGYESFIGYLLFSK